MLVEVADVHITTHFHVTDLLVAGLEGLAA